MAKKVQTVLGPIDPEKLWVTDMHDHLIRTGGQEVREDRDFLLNDVDKAVKEMEDYYACGGRTLVEAMPLGCGRDVLKVMEVARRSKVNIVMITGFLKNRFYDVMHWLLHYSAEQISGLLVKEITEGMDRYNYIGPIVERVPAKAGMLKAATSYHCITPAEAKALHAVSLAHLETGAPIMTHTEYGTMGMEQVETFKKYGVDPARVTICHIDRNPDFDYHRMVADSGCFLEYDGAGRTKYYPDEVIINLIKRMVDAGYQKQILLGLDLGRASYWKTNNGGPGFCYIMEKFVPRLKMAGISEAAIEDFLVNNPKRALAF